MAVNNKSKNYLKNFENYLKLEKNFSSHTIRAYSADVLCFLIWANDIEVNEIDAKKFSEYLYFISQLNYTKTTIARKIASIRAFYRFLYNMEIVDYNPTDTTRLHYKQAWLDSFLQHLNTLSLTGKQIIIGGDFNVIARDEDVYNINAFQGNALVDPTVRRQFTDITNLPFINTLRFLHPTEIIYSFWDFQMGAAQRNLGILLDYIFISSRMQARLTSAGVYKDYRYKPKPSDHAPVFCELQEA